MLTADMRFCPNVSPPGMACYLSAHMHQPTMHFQWMIVADTPSTSAASVSGTLSAATSVHNHGHHHSFGAHCPWLSQCSMPHTVPPLPLFFLFAGFILSIIGGYFVYFATLDSALAII